MTLEEIRNTLPLNGDGDIYMELYNNVISPESFIELFNGASLTYESLHNHPNATQGWQNQFDAWKEQGILV